MVEQKTENLWVGSSSLSLNTKMNSSFQNILINIKNGLNAKKMFIIQEISIKNKKLLDILWQEGYILGYTFFRSSKKKIYFKIFLKYIRSKPAISSLKIITNSQKFPFYSVKQLWKIKENLNTIIFSTNKGLFTLKECKKLKIGGKLKFIIK